jgi:hypothetical protein
MSILQNAWSHAHHYVCAGQVTLSTVHLSAQLHWVMVTVAQDTSISNSEITFDFWSLSFKILYRIIRAERSIFWTWYYRSLWERRSYERVYNPVNGHQDLANTNARHISNVPSHCQQCEVSNVDKTSCIRVTYRWGAFAWPLLLWKSNKCYTLSCVTSMAVSYFSTVLHKRHDLRKQSYWF